MRTMLHAATLSIFVAVSASTAAAQAQPDPRPQKLNKGDLKLGDRVPSLELEGLLQAPAGASIAAELTAKRVLVLEFWATTCGPCIAAFPHINELAERFRGQPITFISITYEPAPRVEPFLAKRKLNTWIGLDTDRSIINAFAANAIPYTAVIGRDGRIAAFTRPTDLTEEVLRDAIAGKPLTLKDHSENEFVATRIGEAGGGAPAAPGPAPTGPAPLFRAEVTPADAAAPAQLITYGGGLNATGYTLRQAVAAAMGVPAQAVLAAGPLGDEKYNFQLMIANTTDARSLDALRGTIEQTFSLLLTPVTREREVLVLTAPAGHKMAPSDIAQSYTSAPGEIIATAQPMSALVRVLANRLNTVVLDDTGLEGPFDWSLSWDPADPKALRAAVETATGLTLRPANRTIKAVEVVPRPRP